MKYAVYTALAFISLMLFLPRTGSGGIRNLPLLIAILILISAYVIYRAVRRMLLLSRVKNTLRESGYMIYRTSAVPSVILLFGRPDIIAKRHDTTLNIYLLAKVKQPLHYHFDGERTLELYADTRMAVTGRSGGFISKKTETVKKQKRRLGWELDPEKRHALVVACMPARISDRHSAHLYPGDFIDGRILLVCSDDPSKLTMI